MGHNIKCVLFTAIMAVVLGCGSSKQASENPIIVPVPPKLDDSGSTQEGIDAAVQASNQFALELYSKIKSQEEQKDSNIFFSPYSISTALAMTYEGAREQTAKEIQTVFHFAEDAALRRASAAAVYNGLNKSDAKHKLLTANALWVQKDYKLLEDYLNVVGKYYDGKATNVDFAGATEEARKTINAWVEEKTNNLIKDLFPAGSLDDMTRFVLTNAIYFKGTWVKQFDPKDTKEEDFKVSAGKTVKAKMMSRTETQFNYAEDSDAQVLEMQYDGEGLSMLVFLPKGEDITTLENTLTLEKLKQWRSSLIKMGIVVSIPKFKFETKYDKMKETLKEMGMPSAFIPDTADFSGISGAKDLYIKIVVHQAYVDVNEEGTEAAAATGVGGSTTSVPPPPTIFRVDHPFLFIIQERKTGNILFFGRVMNPAA